MFRSLESLCVGQMGLWVSLDDPITIIVLVTSLLEIIDLIPYMAKLLSQLGKLWQFLWFSHNHKSFL